MYSGLMTRDRREQSDRKPGDDPARHPALSRERLDHPLQRDPVAHGVRHAVEDLRRVAARLALKRRDQRDLLEVLAVHAVHDHLQGLVERDAQALVGEHAAELALGRLGRVFGDDAERAGERVAGAHRRRDDLQVVGQLVAEQQPLLAHPARDQRPGARGNAERQQSEQRARRSSSVPAAG